MLGKNLLNKVPTKRFNVFICLGIFILFIFLFLDILKFEENDDVLMALIAKGNYAQESSSFLVFMNVIYGSFIQMMYNLSDNIEWYTLCFLIFNIISISIIGNRIFSICRSTIAQFVIFLFIAGLYCFHFSRLQFTSTACLLAIAGLLEIKNFKHVYFGCFLFILASLIRFEAAFFILLIGVPLFIPGKINFGKTLFGKQNVTLLICLMVCFSLKYIDSKTYAQEAEWKEYSSYNLERGTINNNPNIHDEDLEIPSSLNKTEAYFLFHFFINSDKIKLTQLQELNSNLRNLSFSKRVKNISNLSTYKIWISLLITILIANLIFKILSKKSISFVLFFLLVISFLVLDKTVKPRIFFNGLTASLAFMLFSSKLFDNRAKRIILLPLTFIIGIGLGRIGFQTNKSEIHQNQKSYLEQLELINRYVSEDKSIICFSGDLLLECANPLNISLNYPNNKVFFSGWLTNFPLNDMTKCSFSTFNKNSGLFISKKNFEGNKVELEDYIGSKAFIKEKLNDEGLGEFYIVEFR